MTTTAYHAGDNAATVTIPDPAGGAGTTTTAARATATQSVRAGKISLPARLRGTVRPRVAIRT